jgi:hypothetical protein
MMKINMRTIQNEKLILRLLNESIEGYGGLSDKIEGKNLATWGNIK